jgi:RNA polymerase sigma-70 factor (family 1)
MVLQESFCGGIVNSPIFEFPNIGGAVMNGSIAEERKRVRNLTSQPGMTLEVFKSLFDTYYKPLKRFLYYKLADIDLAEDITQEVFVKAWDKRDTIMPDTAKSYLYKIANNLAINHFNSAKTRFELKLEHHDSPVAESPDYVMEKDEFAEKLNRALEELPESQRVVFLMNRIDDLTYREIAERLDISVKAVEKRMHGALESLRAVTQSKI